MAPLRMFQWSGHWFGAHQELLKAERGFQIRPEVIPAFYLGDTSVRQADSGTLSVCVPVPICMDT